VREYADVFAGGMIGKFLKRGQLSMNKKELVAAIAEKSNLTLAQAETILTTTFDTIQAALVLQDSVAIPGFGNFTTKVREERKGRNPGTGKEIIIPRAIVPVFKPGTQLKESVNTVNEKE
jgi:DNA-binding protein HU-beta